VNKQLASLIKLQETDSAILELMRMIETFPRKIRNAEAPLQECQNVLHRLKLQCDALEKKKREKERRLEDIDEKIKKLKARTGEIKTNKEYQALLKEIESVEHERSSIEDDILLVMEELDTLGKQIKSEEQNCKRNSQIIDQMKKEIEGDKAKLEHELVGLKNMREKIAGEIDHEVYSQYIMLIEIYHGHAVNEVREEICQGCNMNIPPQLFVEIKKNEEIYQCPQCRRILFFRESTPESGQPPDEHRS